MQKKLTLGNGDAIAYWEYHPDAKITMVLIHGFTGSHEGFEYMVPLMPEVHFIVPDLPGFGVSDLPKRQDWTIDGIAALTNDFISQLFLYEPPILLGHSMGGLIVPSMIYQKPELFDSRVMLISPVPTSIRGLDSRRVGMIFGALEYRIGHTTGKFGEKLVKSRTISRSLTRLMLHTKDKQRRREIYQHHFDNLDHISDIEFYEKMYSDTNRRGAINYVSELRKRRVLLIAGDKDTVVPLREVRKLAAALNHPNFVIIPNVGHLIHYEKAPEAVDKIRTFISE